MIGKVTGESTPSSSSSAAAGGSSSGSSSSSAIDFIPATSQTNLDSSIKSAISAELSRLRKQEAQVQQAIQAQLEKENLDIESKHSASKKEGSGSSAGRSSHSLQQELDAVRSKIQRHDGFKEKLTADKTVKDAREKVVRCYAEKGEARTLDCWGEAKAFQEAVQKAEKVSCEGDAQGDKRSLCQLDLRLMDLCFSSRSCRTSLRR